MLKVCNMTGCDACRPARPGFIKVLKGNREVWGPCICNAQQGRRLKAASSP